MLGGVRHGATAVATVRPFTAVRRTVATVVPLALLRGVVRPLRAMPQLVLLLQEQQLLVLQEQQLLQEQLLLENASSSAGSTSSSISKVMLSSAASSFLRLDMMPPFQSC